MSRLPHRSAPLAIVLGATLALACEEEVPTPRPTEVCLDRTAAEMAGLCDVTACVEKERVVRVDTKSSPGFSLSHLCPTAEELAQSGARLENYALAYELTEPRSGMNVLLAFDGLLCAEPVGSADALKRHFVGADAYDNEIPVSNGGKGESLTTMGPQDVTFVTTDQGRVHLRTTVHFTKLLTHTDEPFCSGPPMLPLPRPCSCEYAGAFDYVLDLNVPLPAYTP